MEFERGTPAPLRAGAAAGRVLVTLGLLALASCVSRQGLYDREPDYVAKFSGSPEAVAKCIDDEWFNEVSLRRLVTSNRDGMVRMSSLNYSPYVVMLVWELTLRPDGVAEVRGRPTIWGWSHGEEVIPLVEGCSK